MTLLISSLIILTCPRINFVQKNIMKTLLIITIFCIAGLMNVSGQDKSQEMLNKAIYEEEVNGNLEEAIEVYQTILDKFSDNRSIAAKAQYHIGLCNEKQGKKEATKAYQLVLDKFPDQGEVVRLARRKLSALAGLETTSIPAGPSIRHVRYPQPFPYETKGVSTDGRYFTLINWTTIEIAIWDRKTGEVWDLTDKGTWDHPWQYPDHAICSPDGKTVAYLWYTGDDAELRLVNIDGTEDRVLVRGKFGRALWPYTFSHNGNYIIGARHSPESTAENIIGEIVLVSVNDGSVRIIKTVSIGAEHLDFSSDGKFIIGDFPQEEGSPERDIYLIPLDGSQEIPVVQNAANDHSPHWVPGSNQFVFISNRTGNNALWSLELDHNGQPGKPQLLRGELEESFGLYGITTDGDIYYHTSMEGSDVFLTSIDFEAGQLLDTPKKISNETPGKSQDPKWSPDGNLLAYRERTRIPAYGTYLFKINLIIKDLRNGETKIIETELVGNLWSEFNWSPSGKSIIVSGVDQNEQVGFYKVDISSGKISPHKTEVFDLQNHKLNLGYHPKYTQNGKYFYYLDYLRKEIIRIDISSGEETTVLKSDEDLGYFLVSPDERKIVFNYRFNNTNSLFVIPTSGGEVKKLGTINGISEIRIISLTSDSNKIWCLGWNDASDMRIYGISMDGIISESLELKELAEPKNLRGIKISIHPDGKTVAVSLSSGFGEEMWVMENFLSQK